MATRLFQCEGVEEQWRTVVAPWLQEQADNAWRDARPTVVLTPGRGESFYLRGRWLEEKGALLGVRFWTPSDARTFLLEQIPGAPMPALHAERRLAARVAAEELLAADNSEEQPSLKSVAREPEPFLNAYDLLLGAGWSLAEEGAVYGRKLAAKFERLLLGAGVATQAGVHRALRRHAAANETAPIANLLVAGFNANHWPLWDLVRAIVAAADGSTISLLKPRAFAEKVDQLWIGSWEEVFAPAVEISQTSDEGEKTPFAPWIDAYESSGAGSLEDRNVAFIATAELSTQVEAIALQALGWLRDKSCHRLGIVFAEENALSLGVAEQLRRLGVPLDEGTHYWQPGLFEKRAWQSWLALQEEPSVERLVAWSRACEVEGISWGAPEGIAAREVADMLDFALGETLVDNLDFLRLYLVERTDRSKARDVAGFLQRRTQLPEDGTFAEFWAATRRALEALGWSDHLARIESGVSALLDECGWKISRRTFLKWLAEATDSKEMARGEESNHFYGRVHLLIYAQLPGQTWTHLILTGLNEGRWPRAFESGAFGSKHELALLNRHARGLNRLAAKQGRQGEGHETVREDRGYCLLPLERQELALRDLCAAVEATSAGVCFAAITQDAGRALMPSDFFAQAWQAWTGEVLDEAAFRALATRTSEMCRKKRGLLSIVPEDKQLAVPDVEPTRMAYMARRKETEPFGRYEFAYSSPPPEPIQLACKDWENAWNHPATAWLGNVVGVAAWPEGQLAWPRAVGTWAHRWLAFALKGCGGDPEKFSALLRQAAESEAQRIRAIADRAEVDLYPWWEHVWGHARSIALGLGENLAPELARHRLFSEYRLPSGLRVALPGTDVADFELRGRIDLLLVTPASPSWDSDSGDFSGCSCWIVDFKTGSASTGLTKKKLEKGAGLQAYLYALAVHARGGEGIGVSLQTFDAPLAPQIQIGQVLENTALFKGLDRLQREGIFGMRADAQNEYGYAPGYPMATRFISPEILNAKWKLVHGEALAPEDSDS
jgi:PD-(D/E)XK nuclease superfamily protein